MRLSSTERKTYRVYALIDPHTRRAHYVGQTAAMLGIRLDGHLRKPGATAKGDWIRALREQERDPQIVLLEEFEGYRRDAYERETRWITRLRAEGHPLTNNVRREVASAPTAPTEDGA